MSERTAMERLAQMCKKAHKHDLQEISNACGVLEVMFDTRSSDSVSDILYKTEQLTGKCIIDQLLTFHNCRKANLGSHHIVHDLLFTPATR